MRSILLKNVAVRTSIKLLILYFSFYLQLKI